MIVQALLREGETAAGEGKAPEAALQDVEIVPKIAEKERHEDEVGQSKASNSDPLECRSNCALADADGQVKKKVDGSQLRKVPSEYKLPLPNSA